MADDFYGPNAALAFRRYAAREMKRPAVDLRDLSDDDGGDILKLALLSIREHFANSAGNKRADGQPFSVYPAYLDDILPDAFAAEQDNVHLCGVHVGLGAAFYEFALFCFSQQAMFREIGDPGVETDPAPIEEYPPGFLMREVGASMNEEAFVEMTRGLLPRNRDRSLTANFLCVLMLRFVWLHELYHCLNGHVGFANHQGWSRRIRERKPVKKRDVPPADLRRLELDADQSSLVALVKIQLAGIENVEAPMDLPAPAMLELSLFAAYATTWMMEEYARRDADRTGDSHPLPYQRLHNMVRTYASNLFNLVPDAKAVHDRVMDQMTAFSTRVSTFPSGVRLMTDLRDTAIQDVLDAEQDALENLRRDLAPFRFSFPSPAS